MICPECGGGVSYDPMRDELVCSGCGLTDIIDNRGTQTLHCGDFYKTAFNGKAIYNPTEPETFEPNLRVMGDGYGKNDTIFYQKTEERGGVSETARRSTAEYMPVYALNMEPEATGDGDEADIYGSISSDTLRVWKQEGPGNGPRMWNTAKESRFNPKTELYRTFWRYTHSEIPNQPRIRTFLKNRFWVACKRLDEELSYKEARRAAKRCQNKATCKNCRYRMELSFKERERGMLLGEKKEGVTKVDEKTFIVVEFAGGISQIDRRFSWPYQCLETFKALKPVYDNKALLATDAVLSEKHKILNKIYQNDINYERLPVDRKTIIKQRSKGARSIPAYGHVVYEALPIGKLLKDTKGSGYLAVWCLVGFGALAPMYEIEPNRSNLIEWFKDQDLLDQDVARKYYDLLIEYGVVYQLKRFQRTGLLYLRKPLGENPYPVTKAFFSPMEFHPRSCLVTVNPDFKGYDFARALEAKRSKTAWYSEYYKSRK